MSSPDPFAGAGVTALGLAASRSVESSRADRLIDDPFAQTLFEAAGADLPMRLRWPAPEEALSDAEALHLHGSRYIGLRTRFYDDTLVRAIAEDVRQVVLLGAGLDTRCLRLALPSDLTIYELDQPQVLEFKTRCLESAGIRPRCTVRRLGVDLAAAGPAPLDDTEFDRALPTTWIAEGLFPYLSPDAQTALIAAVNERSARGSWLAFDQIAGGDVDQLSERSGLDMKRLLVSTAGASSLIEGLRSHNWRTTATAAEDLAERYRRDLADPFARARASSAPPWLQTVFVTADNEPTYDEHLTPVADLPAPRGKQGQRPRGGAISRSNFR